MQHISIWAILSGFIEYRPLRHWNHARCVSEATDDRHVYHLWISMYGTSESTYRVLLSQSRVFMICVSMSRFNASRYIRVGILHPYKLKLISFRYLHEKGENARKRIKNNKSNMYFIRNFTILYIIMEENAEIYRRILQEQEKIWFEL